MFFSYLLHFEPKKRIIAPIFRINLDQYNFTSVYYLGPTRVHRRVHRFFYYNMKTQVLDGFEKEEELKGPSIKN